MGIITTRRKDQLQAECDQHGVAWTEDMGRLELFDALREALGGYDAGVEVDPAKCKDGKSLIKWGEPEPFKGLAKYFTNEWIAEPKLDGCRLRLYLGGSSNTINSGRRSVKTFKYTVRTDNFPHLRDAVIEDLAGVILDGEILAPSGQIQTHTGLWTNSLLNASVALCNSNPLGSQATQARFGKAKYWVFDVLAGPGGESVQHLPYDERRQMLERIVSLLQDNYPGAEINIVPQLKSAPESIVWALEEGYEGVVIKKRDSVYKPGKRLAEWLKVKTFSSFDAFIVGYADGENGNEGLVGSLDLALIERQVTDEERVAGGLSEPLGENRSVIEMDGKNYIARAVAQVGNLTMEMRNAITTADGTLRDDVYGSVIECLAQGVGKNGRMRHAHMIRMRPDKTQLDCKLDQLDGMPAV